MLDGMQRQGMGKFKAKAEVDLDLCVSPDKQASSPPDRDQAGIWHSMRLLVFTPT